MCFLFKADKIKQKIIVPRYTLARPGNRNTVWKYKRRKKTENRHGCKNEVNEDVRYRVNIII